MVGKILGKRYELIEKIGSGGMAIVYKARCRLLNRFVAVKILRDEYISDKEFLDKFRREAQSVASLSHQNIVNIYDVGAEDNIPYIVMEYVDGVTLKEYIDNYEGFLKNEDILDFSKQIALGLEHAHSNHIIHRDIKPHNILVTKTGVLKVADFGIASAISETTTSYSSEAIGSVRYSSPEQARGKNVDQRTDIYSLGVLMYEMATRTVPFEGDVPVEIALKHLKDDALSPTTINRCLNKGLESVIMRSLLKRKDERYQSVREFIDDLDKIINNPNENIAFYTFNNEGATQKLPNLDGIKDIDEKGENRTMDKNIKKVKKKKNNKKNKLAIIGVILLAFITVLVVSILIKIGPALRESVPDSISLINVIDMPYEDAKILLEEAGFIVEKNIEESNNYIVAGNVFEQSPKAGAKIKPGYKIKLSISTGAVKETIPNLVHKQFKESEVIIENSNFKLGNVEYVNDDLDKGYVLSQTPKAGEEANNDAIIDLVVSIGQETSLLVMPSLINKNLSDVQRLLLPLDINLRDTTYEYHPSIEKDMVVSQSVPQGTEVETNTSVDIVISMGKEGDDNPDGETDLDVVDPNAVYSKSYNVPVSEHAGTTITIKVIYEKGTEKEIIYNQSHEVLAETTNEAISVEGSGSGILHFYIDDIILTSMKVEFK